MSELSIVELSKAINILLENSSNIKESRIGDNLTKIRKVFKEQKFEKWEAFFEYLEHLRGAAMSPVNDINKNEYLSRENASNYSIQGYREMPEKDGLFSSIIYSYLEKNLKNIDLVIKL